MLSLCNVILSLFEHAELQCRCSAVLKITYGRLDTIVSQRQELTRWGRIFFIVYEDEAERLCTRLPFPVTDWSFECDQCWEIPTSNQPALSFNVDPMYAMMFSLACRSLISLRSLDGCYHLSWYRSMGG